MFLHSHNLSHSSSMEHEDIKGWKKMRNVLNVVEKKSWGWGSKNDDCLASFLLVGKGCSVLDLKIGQSKIL